ncbi:von Willebrand factor type A domain-containing protein [Hygrophoropsis aurantiaca]|uniref:von Willebrand factor type A domain-containing protein n=1 Tax=Hygrophoropsis aurantiaca TaxID=72124 RepID=A0ACB7ZUI2_9AGAM|nr:von Willebrand factor type A domain-containing protein [Hygrophoropsis aurantiaca]
MAGANIDMARTAHTVLLQGLHQKNTTFNMFSFGSRVSSLWPVSQPCGQNSVDTAMSHIKTMQADYSGTEIARALEAVYKSLVTPLVRPVSIFLLTDGGAWDVETCANITKKAIRDHATDSTFMRVFTVGLSQGASTTTCDRIALAGGGMAVYIATSEEEFLGKCARLVRAARTAPVSDIKVYDKLGTAVQQAPSNIPSFFLSLRFQIFVIVPRGAANVEQELKITGFVWTANISVEVVVPLRNLIHSPQTAFIHTSAAKALITELEDITPETNANRANIIRLGTVYGFPIGLQDTSLPTLPRDSRFAWRTVAGERDLWVKHLFWGGPLMAAAHARLDPQSSFGSTNLQNVQFGMSNMPTSVPAARYILQGAAFGSINP